MTRRLELVLFAREPEYVGHALAAGLRSMIVDLEWRGKEERQRGVDTEINRHRPEDLEVLRSRQVPIRCCRLNRFGSWTRDEVEATIAAGATRLLLPMVEAAAEVEATLCMVDGRCDFGILVETERAVEAADRLSRLPLDQVYVGLNDLAISRGCGTENGQIFEALADGTVESLRQAFDGCGFGFGGVTVVDGGEPVPSRLLLAEMARLDCSFSFLRRSFRRDTAARDLATEVARIQQLWQRLLERSPDQIADDRQQLLDHVAATRERIPLASSPR